MTTLQGPPCDLCKEEPSVMSVMNLADHEQLLIGAGCLPAWLQGMLGMFQGQGEDAEATAGEGADAHNTPPEDPPADPPAPDAGPPAPARRARSGSRAGQT